MRAGLSTIQQTLTPEAAAVLNRSIAEAVRRNHGQTTPLHVAATLLAAPSGLLRQACIRSHPTSSHPLQCRALELCFSVALERLPTTANSNSSGSSAAAATVSEPPISNALMAALKRAQAHQRRGCPEQQQQPILAVKVELEQLVVSILDDPSVSRVMREASFSSPAVKATIEQSLSSTPSPSLATADTTNPHYASPTTSSAALGLGLGITHRPPLTTRNLYMNPRLHQQQGTGVNGGDPTRKDEVKRVLDIMVRSKKRNPVLVAEADPAALMREVLQRVETGDAPAPLRAAHVISLEKEFTTTPDRSQIPTKIKELGSSIEARIGDGSGRGVVLDLGDLKWLVESPGGLGATLGSGLIQQQQQQIVSEAGRAAVAEMTKLLQRFGDGGGSAETQVWLVGTATCATYLRCQVYHPMMENAWDIQAVPIAQKPLLSSMFPRLGGNGILSSSVGSLAPIKGFPALATTATPLIRPCESTDSSRRTTLCPACAENYERELATLVAQDFEKSSSSDSKPEARQTLPHWLQPAKSVNTKTTADQLQCKEQSTEGLLKRWRDTCSRLHPNPNPVLIGRERPPALAFPTPVAYNTTLFPPRTPVPPKLSLSRSMDQVKNSHQSELLLSSERRPTSPSGSLVKTDLVLGHPKASDATLDKAHRERIKDSTGCMQDGFCDKQRDKVAGISDFDSFKRLFKGLAEKVGWQPEAASAVATVVMQCKSGNGKPRGVAPKGDTWLLFIGADKVGKRKMAAALSELVFGTGPITIHLGGSTPTDGDVGESNLNFRGRTSIDRVADAVRRNPFSVVVLEGIDRADMLVRGSIKCAIERGRLLDSQGREVGLGSIIFVLTADWLPEELKSSNDSILQCEQRILDLANCGWQLELSVGDKTRKRGAESVSDEDRPTKLRKELPGGTALSLDLNLAVGTDDDTGEGSGNSSDLTVEHEQESARLAIKCSAVSSATELMGSVDDAIVFKPVDFVLLRRKILESVSAKFTAIMGDGRLLRVDEDALDRILGGVWLAGAATTSGFEEWADRVLVPSMQHLMSNLKTGNGAIVIRLSAVKGGQRQWTGGETGGDWLPSTVAIDVDGL